MNSVIEIILAIGILFNSFAIYQLKKAVNIHTAYIRSSIRSKESDI